jgi:HNH endonuclease
VGAVSAVEKDVRLAVSTWGYVEIPPQCWPDNAAGCWMWAGPLQHPRSGPDSYGRIRRQQAHRWVYERLVGPIPAGLVLDHTCEVRQCVNPAHLEPVTQSENMRRHAAKRRQRRERNGVPVQES